MQTFRNFLAALWTNWISLTGAVLTTVGALGALLVTLADVGQMTPYLTALLLVVLPAIFVVGLALVAIGVRWQRRRDRQTSEVAAAIGQVLANRKVAASLMFVGLATLVNVVVVVAAGQKTVRHFSSNAFCGTTCHTPMEPEWTAYSQSAHAHVNCVSCHVGEGVTANVQAKANGVHQLLGVISGDYARPVPPPREHMRGAASRCVSCHTPTHPRGRVVRLFPRYADDDKSSAKMTVLSLDLGGRDPITGTVSGIHAHADPDKRIVYSTSDKEGREVTKVVVYDKDKQVAAYAREGASQPVVEERTMDCLDCHNRAAHTFAIDAADVVDRAIWAGALDRALPSARKTAVRLLSDAHPTREQATGYFESAAKEAWPADATAQPEMVAKAGKTLAAAYLRNVFPDMHVTWGTYQSQLGHRDDATGCFRCHNNDFKPVTIADKHTPRLSKKCDACHAIVADAVDPETFDDSMAAAFQIQ